MGYEINQYRGIRSHHDLPDHEIIGISMCIDHAFGGGITPEDAAHHMQGDQILVAKPSTDPPDDARILGFTSTSINIPHDEFSVEGLSRNPALYFAGAAIAQEAQGDGLYGMMNEYRFDYGFEHDLDLVYTRTQNPRVEEGITSSIERLIEARRIKSFKLARYVCRGAYGKMLTAQKPIARRISYDFLDYDEGDAVILTWQLDI